MRKKSTLVIVLFACLISAKMFAQDSTKINVTITGIVKINNKTDNSGISVVVKSYLINSQDVFGVSATAITDKDGKYSITFPVLVKICGTVPILNTYICSDNIIDVAAIPLYFTFSYNNLTEKINENIPFIKPFADFSYSITKTPLLGGYLPQIGLVTVDTVAGFNKNLIVWHRKDSTTIASYNILKASTVNGVYTVIGNVLQSAAYSVFRDSASNPGVDKAFYKIEAVYSDATQSPQSYPKAPLSLNISLLNGLPNLSFINKDDIPLFDHGLYKSISVLRSEVNVRNFIEFNKFDFSVDESTALLNLYTGLTDQTTTRYTYLAVGELVDSISTLKSDSGPFSQSMSNLAESQLTGSSIVSELGLTVSPNPSKGIITISIPENGALVLVDVLGNIVSSTIVSKGIVPLEIKSSGIYTVILRGAKIYKAKVAIE
jgi:hypothetical protein